MVFLDEIIKIKIQFKLAFLLATRARFACGPRVWLKLTLQCLLSQFFYYFWLDYELALYTAYIFMFAYVLIFTSIDMNVHALIVCIDQAGITLESLAERVISADLRSDIAPKFKPHFVFFRFYLAYVYAWVRRCVCKFFIKPHAHLHRCLTSLSVVFFGKWVCALFTTLCPTWFLESYEYVQMLVYLI